ncbi:hypothetical protein KFE25_001837 [Diacronema lutheri]|uniref:CWH43-like N-terminal domain-containing protein n=1 Tax=Diacronema lutheri TaxID=2081491 RepID=A0A8J5XEH9_DIALT|nr:hypothetical protein KFE25_001837 [Diacronema lutheri]
MLHDESRLEVHVHPLALRGDAVLAAFLSVGVLTFVVTYSLSWTVETRRLTLPYLFLSEAIDEAPSSCVGSFLLSPACALMALVVLLRKEQLAYVSPPLRLWWLGPVGALGGHGVASFQVHNAPIAHYAFAGVFFGALTFYVMASAWHERAHSVPVRSELCSAVRATSAIVAPLLVLGATAIAPPLALAIAAGEPVEFEEPRDFAAHTAVFFGALAVLEVAFILAMAAHFASLLPELRGVIIAFNITRAGERC